MILLLSHNGMIVLSGMVLGAKRKNKTRPPPRFTPFTNHSRSNFVTPPADLNSDVAGANGMWVVWGVFGEEDSGSGVVVGGMRPLLYHSKH